MNIGRNLKKGHVHLPIINFHLDLLKSIFTWICLFDAWKEVENIFSQMVAFMVQSNKSPQTDPNSWANG